MCCGTGWPTGRAGVAAVRTSQQHDGVSKLVAREETQATAGLRSCEGNEFNNVFSSSVF